MSGTDTPGRWLMAAAVVAAAGLYLTALGDRAIWSEEVRWAEIPREMAATGGYFWPTINGHTYYDKPLGSYWLVLAAAAVTGGVDEFAARLPSAVAGVLSVVLLMGLVRRFHDARTAALAGAVLATCYGFAFFSRTASTDVETVAGLLAALSLGTATDGAWGWRRTVAFWLILALTSLTKGLLGFVLPVLVLGCYHTFAAEEAWAGPGVGGWLKGAVARNCWFFQRWTVPAVLLAAAVYFVPFAVSVARTGSAEGLGMVWRENVRRFFDAHNHRGPVYLYAYVILGLAAPWAGFLPAAVLKAVRPADRGDRLAAAFFWSVVVFFTLSSSRRSYYLLPVLPAVAWLVARVLLTPAADLTPWVRRLRTAGYLASAAGVVAAGLALLPAGWRPVLRDLPDVPSSAILAAGWLAAVASMVAVGVRFTPGRAATAAAGLAVAGTAAVYLVVLPAAEPYRTARPFLEEVRRTVGDDPSGLALYRTREAVWYLDLTPVPECESADELAGRLARGESRWGLLKEQDLDAVAERVRVALREPVFPWDGPEVAGKKLVLVERPAVQSAGR